MSKNRSSVGFPHLQTHVSLPPELRRHVERVSGPGLPDVLRQTVRDEVSPVSSYSLRSKRGWDRISIAGEGIVGRPATQRSVQSWPHPSSSTRVSEALQGFLLALETFINEELSSEQKSTQEANGESLTVFSAAFDRFIQGFETYGDFLRKIKSAYETTIESLRREIESHKARLGERAAVQTTTRNTNGGDKETVALLQSELENMKMEAEVKERQISELRAENATLRSVLSLPLSPRHSA